LRNLILAFKSFFAVLFTGKLSDPVAYELGLMRRMAPPAAAKPAAPAAQAGPAEGAVQMLALLQSESRLVDFLQEDISGYSDEQVGSAMRGVHEKCRSLLGRHVKLAPIVDGVEGTPTRLASAGLDSKDASTVKLVGNVPPDGNVEAGILRHRGWQVERIDLPAVKRGGKTLVVAPAEIEVE
jgi:hypothetical protein